MGIVFNVPGQPEVGAASRGGMQPAVVGPLGTVKQAVRVGSQRAGGTVVRVEAEPDEDVVVLQIAGGPELFLHPETARDLLRAQSAATRGSAAQMPSAEVAVPVHLDWQGLRQAAPASRSALGDVVLAGFKVLGFKAGARLTAREVVERVDQQVAPGVHRLQRDTLQGLDSSTVLAKVPAAAAAGAPLLVLVHGTFSSTEGTFGKLWQQHGSQVARLFEAYGDRVYALEHHTLGKSPIENARDLAEVLPNGATLHLLTHSRGGLVAEALARACGSGALNDEDRALFGQRPEELRALETLLDFAREKRLRVERVVRVACPARGTLLASRRLDAYLSVFKWTLQLAGVPVAPALLSFLADVARLRLDPNEIPGLAAQVPDSPLVQWLHRVEASIPGGLRVVAGDVQGDSISSWLKTLVADAFYWVDNDLVVQTRSMYGGTPRAAGASFVFDRGGAVSHFAYFSNETTVPAIVEALLKETPAGFRTIGPLSWAGQDDSGVRGASRAAASGPATSKPALVLLPGIAGSNLKVGGQRVWLGWRLVNGLRRLEYRSDASGDVEPDGVVGRVYDSLIGFFSGSHEVIVFDFDWRLPIEQEARRLGRIVQEALQARAASAQPVRLLAHSMGGLVARVMQLECPQVWKSLMAHPGARLLMLGTPNGGSWAPMQVLSGDDTFGNTLTAFGAPFRDHDARQMLAGFPGLLQMQRGLLDPAQEGDMGGTLDREATWRRLADEDFERAQRSNWWHHDLLQLNLMRWGVPPQAVLDAAVALRKRLDKQLEELPAFADRLVLVLGQARRTPDGCRMAGQGLEYLDVLDEGDGRVPDRSARLPGVRTWRADTDHGSLPSYDRAHAAYLELLEKGETTLLTAVPQAAASTRSATTPRYVPSRPSREGGTLGSAAVERPDPMVPPLDAANDGSARQALRIRLLNGDLGFVSQPLLVGHYTALGLTGSEKDVDRLLGGSLGRSLATGLYPQQAGVLQVFHNTRLPPDPWRLPQPQAVVVVGLGPEGKLRPADLVRAVRAGVLAWATRLAELPDAPPRFDLAATLIGSGGLGIGAGQSAQLVAQGVREAHERLQAAASDSAKALPQLDTLVLVERYLDRATEAWRALNAQALANPGAWEVEPAIVRTDSALDRPVDASYRGADYDLILATTEEDVLGNSAISYRLDTRRARSEVQSRKTQGRLLRRLVADSVEGDGRYGDIGRTLFQLLVPLEMESFLNSSTETQIEVDEGAAAIPWELLDTPRERELPGTARRPPWGIRSKLLRKLRSVDFRLQVSDADRDAGVLVIGEPACPANYLRLPGARREARGVLARLQGSGLLGPVRELIAGDDETRLGPSAAAVINTLLERDWRIVHIAGHGEPPLYEDALPGWSPAKGDGLRRPGEAAPRLVDPRGVVLSDGIFLGPREIESMRVVPELVFVNCCFSGARRSSDVMSSRPANLADTGSRPGFAAGVAQELIRIGVRCVVATGWAVDDAAAEAFASGFYGALLRGSRFIDAVDEARRAAYAMGGNTWGAYQCYGDPDWTLQYGMPDAQAPQAARGPAEPQRRYAGIASAPALVLALKTLAVQAAHGGAATAEVSRDLQWLRERFQARWGTLASVREAFGQVYKATGDLAQAIEWFRLAMESGDGSATLRSTEERYNLQARQAWEDVAQRQTQLQALQHSDHPAQDRLQEAESALQQAAGQARGSLEEALQGLELLVALQPTAERQNLCGSACKRLAQAMSLAQPEAADGAVEAIQRKMVEHYSKAYQLARKEPGAPSFYPAMNLLAAQLSAGQADGEPPPQEVLALASEYHQRQPDFWSAAAVIEVTAWKALLQEKLHEQLPALLAAFDDLHDRVHDPSKWRSVHDQARFVVGACLGRMPADSAQAPAAQALLDRLAAFAYPAV